MLLYFARNAVFCSFGRRDDVTC